jgi:uracil-DNA glycosylase
MQEQALGAADFLPEKRGIEDLREAAQGCRGCDLYKTATQTVFGAGLNHAHLMLVGEQPGDKEDLHGLPFVGPAGNLLFRALEDLKLTRDRIYITNAVKHFKWQPRGKRRIHQTPRASEVRACLPWLEAEIDAVRPKLIACLGATAVGALLGSRARVSRDRRRVLESDYGPCLVTVHPSGLLRIEDESERNAAYEAFVQDLRHGLDYLERAGLSPT